jgi:hypothetical protein
LEMSLNCLFYNGEGGVCWAIEPATQPAFRGRRDSSGLAPAETASAGASLVCAEATPIRRPVACERYG